MKIVKLIGTLFGWLLVIALLVLVVAFICMLIGSRCRKNDDVRRKQDSKSKVQPKLRKDAPQPTSDQQRLHEIEESIFCSTVAIQANPMSRGATALSEEIQHLEREKMDLLKKIADNMDQITVQKAWNTFLPEQQEKFQERIYQYQQDVNRGGTEPEIAAANRGMVFVDGRPVAKEVATRLDEMRNAVSLKEAERTKVQQTLDDAVKSLRDQIITEITERPDVKYQLTKLLYEDAASCFPNGGYQWDGAFFQLDLINRKLLVEVSTYPNQFGACQQDFFPLSPAEFNRIAKKYHMRPELQAFHSDEDWAMLFDDNLKTVISSACAALQKQKEERQNKQRKMLAVKISSELAGLLPDMDISEVTIELRQRYGSSSIKIVNENGEYHISSYRSSYASNPRMLSSAEAVWLEQQIENTINDPDDSTWQSLPGGDTMNIAIKWNHGKDISLRGVKAIRKYVDLMGKLENLTEYGSQEELKEESGRIKAVSSDNVTDTAQTGKSQKEAVFVLYERNWAGQAAENGEDKIFLKVFEDECVITYERLSRNCYATPPIEDVQTKVRYRSLSTISTWSLEKLLLYINRIFHLSINLCDCCSEQHYLAWIENHNTEFYSMEIMFDGKKQACMVRRENEKFCEEIRFQGQTYFWKQSKAIHGLWYNDYAEEVCLNEKVYYLYHSEIPNKNDTLCWIVSQITESVFELLHHQPCNKEEIVFEKEIGRIGGDEPGRRGVIHEVLALATGRTIGYYRADDGTRKICLGRIPETVVPNDNLS